MTDKDLEQDAIIHDNAVRIARNEAAIKRQTAALEQIRDHFYPPPERWWKKAFAFFVKVVCVIVAYLGIAQTVDWLWTVRESDALAERFVKVGQRLYAVEGDVSGAIACYEKAITFNSKKSDYVMTLTFLKGMGLVADYADNGRPPTDDEQVRINSALAEAIVLKELQPKSPMPYVLMAQTHVLNGEKDAAVEAIEQAVARAPKQASVHVSACAIYHLSGRVAEARAHLKVAENLDPNLPLGIVWKGILALWDDHDAATARACFERTLRQMPRIASIHHYLGRALMAEKEPDIVQVRASFSRALVLDAKLTSAMLGMAETYERENNSVLARLWLDRAIAVDANYLPALIQRARVFMKDAKDGDSARAIADLTAAIALSPFRADLYQLRAEAHEKAGHAVQADADRRTAVALEKDQGFRTAGREG